MASPKGIHHLESIANYDPSVVYFASEVTNVLENMTDNCREIKKVARYKGTLVFTDVGG